MVVPMIDLVVAAVSWVLTKSRSPFLSSCKTMCSNPSLDSLQHPSHPPYKAIGGYYNKEAIMILRRFYITENTNGECYL